MTSSPPWPLGPHPGGQVTVHARSLRGLAHPLRMRILGLLRAEGPSTATRLAERLRLTSGATSYHLRQLAAYGFIVEDDTRGPGRERWWRAAHQSTKIDAADGPADKDELTEAYLRSLAAVYAEQLDRVIDQWLTLPEHWRRVQRLSDFALRLTAEELAQFNDEVLELISHYRADQGDDTPDAPPDSAAVTIQVHSYRTRGTQVAEEDV